MLAWSDAVNHIADYVVKVMTPSGFGTGFLISCSPDGELLGVATAAHVVSHSHSWEEPIRIQHYRSGEVIVLKDEYRAVLMDDRIDTAAIIFARQNIPFPDDTLSLTPEGMHLRVGREIGWVGFPALSPNDMCFFTGRVSAFLEDQTAYLVDGVVINGVSGGPAFTHEEDGT